MINIPPKTNNKTKRGHNNKKGTYWPTVGYWTTVAYWTAVASALNTRNHSHERKKKKPQGKRTKTKREPYRHDIAMYIARLLFSVTVLVSVLFAEKLFMLRRSSTKYVGKMTRKLEAGSRSTDSGDQNRWHIATPYPSHCYRRRSAFLF